MKQVTDLTGQVFGKLLVLDYAGRAENGKHRWRVRCECGTEKVVFASNLFSGKTRSCGCARHEEGRKRRKPKTANRARLCCAKCGRLIGSGEIGYDFGGGAVSKKSRHGKVWLFASGDSYDLSIFPSEFGKTVFLTREEAERAIQEMEGKA